MITASASSIKLLCFCMNNMRSLKAILISHFWRFLFQLKVEITYEKRNSANQTEMAPIPNVTLASEDIHATHEERAPILSGPSSRRSSQVPEQ